MVLVRMLVRILMVRRQRLTVLVVRGLRFHVWPGRLGRRRRPRPPRRGDRVLPAQTFPCPLDRRLRWGRRGRNARHHAGDRRGEHVPALSARSRGRSTMPYRQRSGVDRSSGRKMHGRVDNRLRMARRRGGRGDGDGLLAELRQFSGQAVDLRAREQTSPVVVSLSPQRGPTTASCSCSSWEYISAGDSGRGCRRGPGP